MANDLVVVDLSHHNATPDFVTAKNAGLIGVIHKATEGTSYKDSKYESRKAAAQAAGVAFCSYHFLKSGYVEQQMDFYLDTVKPVPGERVVIDYEDAKVVLSDLRTAIKRIRARDPSLQITVYSGHTIKDQLGSAYDELLASTSLWIAQYTSAAAPSWPKGTWKTWTLWQYSDGSAGGSPKNLNGIAAPHDCNAFNGSRENCLKWMLPAGAAPQPEPEPEPSPETPVVKINIEVEGAQVLISVNGEIVGSAPG